MSDDKDFTKVVSWFKNDHVRAMVALSGGVDSAVVALAESKHWEITCWPLRQTIRHYPEKN